MPEIITSAY